MIAALSDVWFTRTVLIAALSASPAFSPPLIHVWLLLRCCRSVMESPDSASLRLIITSLCFLSPPFSAVILSLCVSLLLHSSSLLLALFSLDVDHLVSSGALCLILKA